MAGNRVMGLGEGGLVARGLHTGRLLGEIGDLTGWTIDALLVFPRIAAGVRPMPVAGPTAMASPSPGLAAEEAPGRRAGSPRQPTK